MNKILPLIALTLLLVGCQKGTDPQSPTVGTDSPPTNQTSQLNLTDPCQTFPDDLVAAALGKPIVKHELKTSGPSTSCHYYVDNTAFANITVSNLDPEIQKKGATAMDRTLTTDGSIAMDHFITVQEDGHINAIYLVTGPNQFIRVDRTSLKAADNQTLVSLASQVAAKIK